MHETQNDKFGSQYVAWLTFAFFIVAGIVVYVFTTANPNSALGMLMRGRPLPGVNRVQPYPTSSLKPDEFRLTVSHVVDNSDQLLVHLTIQTLQPQWYEISSRGTLWLGQSVGKASSGTVEDKPGPADYYSTTVTLEATQISYKETQLARLNLGGGLTSVEVPLKTPLEKILILTAKDDVYPLERPLLIGQQFGVDVQLVVGERGKVEAKTSVPIVDGEER